MKFNEEMMEARTQAMCKDPFWDAMYRESPPGARRRLRVAFWGSKGVDEGEDLPAYRAYREKVESEMTYEDAAYLAERFPEGPGKKHYVEMRENIKFASLKTVEKLDEAIDLMAAHFSAEDREAVGRTRKILKGCEDPFVKYEWLWSAVGGNGEDCCMMGDVFDHGHGVKRDVELAVFWFTRGALCGDGDSCCRLASLLGDDEEPCFDFAAANFWYREALRRRYPGVKASLAWRLAFGEGAWAAVRNPSLAVDLLRSGLGEDEDGRCHSLLGRCYEEGVGVRANVNTAVRYYFRALRRDKTCSSARKALERLGRLAPEDAE